MPEDNKDCPHCGVPIPCALDDAKDSGKIELLSYLIGVAQKEGAELWRALFAEMRARIEAER